MESGPAEIENGLALAEGNDDDIVADSMPLNYFRIEETFNQTDRVRLKDPETQEGDKLDPRLFTKGRNYDGLQPLRIPVRSGTRPADFIFGPFDMPVVRPVVAEQLQRLAPRDVQRIQARLEGDYGWFEIVNVITLRKAINEDLSEISWWTEADGLPHKVGQYAGIGALVLNRSCIGNAAMFRLQDWKLPLIVSEEVKDVLEKMNTSGISFKALRTV